jgi:5-methylcytosine-specific restriction endonuclease McrA
VSGRTRQPCVSCGAEKAPGRRNYCDPCAARAAEAAAQRTRERTARWHAENAERSRAYQAERRARPGVRERDGAAEKAWREANAERAKQVKDAWNAANLEKVRAYSREWRQRNPDGSDEARVRNRENVRRWRQENPEKARELSRIKESARRARKRGQFVEPIHPLIVLERADGVCGICGGDVDPFSFHVDHIIPLARGGEHSYQNVQPAHPACNTKKGARVPRETT